MEIIKKELNINFIKKWMSAGINPIILSILNRRSIETDEELLNSLSPIFENIESPFLFKNLTTAFYRLDKAIKNKEKIIIFGDRDVDGATSIAIIYDYLKSLNADINWDIPQETDPYGLNKDKINLWVENKYKLCISVDCGITNIDEVEALRQNDIDTIIIDHHEPLSILPNANSIINPKAEDNFAFKNIAACGVVFLFVLGHIFYKSSYFDKKIALFYADNNKYFLDIYLNLIKTETINITNIESINSIHFDYLYSYNENITLDLESKKVLATNNVKVLLPISKTYNNPILSLISNTSFKAKLSCFNSIFHNIKAIEIIKEQYLPLVMLGTVADVMPLIKINRIFTYLGLELFKKFNHVNMQSLCRHLNIEQETISSKDISWTICPIINAPGRMGDASITVNLLIDFNNEDKKAIKDIITINEQRKVDGDKAFQEFANEISGNKLKFNNNLAFFYSDQIPSGITGITATKLVKHTNCATIVAAKEGEYYVGSIRGKTDYHFVDFLEKASEFLLQFGGHKEAAGFRLHETNLESFRNFLINNSSLFTNASVDDKIYIDAEIPKNYLNYELYKILRILEPFGVENQNPILYTSGLKVHNFSKMGKDKQHLKLYFDTDPIQIVGIFWDKAEWFEKIYQENNNYDVVYQLEINKFNDQITLQMVILNLKTQEEKI